MATRIDAEEPRARGGANPAPGYVQILREIGDGAKALARSEIALIRAEIELEIKAATKHLQQTAVFGGLVALSVLPFLAFLVIGLGDLLDGRYWLSSLIVAVACAAVGGTLAFRAYRRLKERDLTLPRSRRSIRESADELKDEVEDIKDAVKGDFHGSEGPLSRQ